MRDLLNVQLMLWKDGFCFLIYNTIRMLVENCSFHIWVQKHLGAEAKQQFLSAVTVSHVGFKEGQDIQDAAGILCRLHHGCLLPAAAVPADVINIPSLKVDDALCGHC